jgi:predicted lipoprotein with Yx(FWY)xxD motif
MRWLLRVTGAALLAASAAIHLDLYLTGYRTIPTIGWLFLLQVIATFALAAAILLVPFLVSAARRALNTRRPAADRALAAGDAALAAAGAGFALATLGGYLLSLWVGLFGFREVRTTAGVTAGILDIAAFAVLAVLAALIAKAALADYARAPGSGAPAVADAGTSRLANLRRASSPSVVGVAVGGVAVAAFAVLGASVATASGGGSATTASGSTLLRTTTIGGVSVVTNASGRTLYWFAPDMPDHSVCYGTCAAYWPPVTGSPTAGPGVTGKLGTTHRTDGTLQVTYDGHPLYTYIGDSGPGQASGNNVNLNGGFWHEVPAAG